MNAVSAVQQSFQQMANLLQVIATEPFNVAEKIAKTNIEMQIDGPVKEPFKGEQIDITA